MGCMNTHHTQSQSSKSFSSLSEKPQQTVLYNLLRKHNDIQIIRPSSSAKIFFKEEYPNLTALTPRDVKMLYSFKNVLFVGNCVGVRDRILVDSQPKTIYSITEEDARSFLKQFPIFGHGSILPSPKHIPLLPISTPQIAPRSTPAKHIFLHSTQNNQASVTSRIREKELSVVGDSAGKTTDQLLKELMGAHGDDVLFLHQGERRQPELLEILSEYLVRKYNVDATQARLYVQRYLPNTTVDISSILNKQIPQKTASKEQLSTTQQLQLILQSLQLQQSSGPPSQLSLANVSRSYSLVLTLLTNICNNPGVESYRSVRKKNPQIHEQLGKYKSGVQLLKEVGFTPINDNYVNALQEKYLKVLRVELELAWRKFGDLRQAN